MLLTRPGLFARAASVVFVTLISSTAFAQYPDGVKEDDFNRAIQFYTEGGSFCFRLAPVEAPDKETEWKILILTSKSSKKTSYRLGDVQLGEGSSLSAISAGLNVQIVMNDPKNRAEFFKRFAEGIDKGVLRARLIKTSAIERGKEVPLSTAIDLKGSELIALRDLEQAR